MAILDAVAITRNEAMCLAWAGRPQLEVYGHRRSKTVIASMDFDVAALHPTYHLLIAVPPRSNALEISEPLRLHLEDINAAGNLMEEGWQHLHEWVLASEDQEEIYAGKQKRLSAELRESERLIGDLWKECEGVSCEKGQELSWQQQDGILEMIPNVEGLSKDRKTRSGCGDFWVGMLQGGYPGWRRYVWRSRRKPARFAGEAVR